MSSRLPLCSLLLAGAPLLFGCASERPTPDAGSAAELLSGRVVVLQEDGERLEDASGVLIVHAQNESLRWSAKLDVVDGRFEFEPQHEPVELLAVSYGTLDERSVVADSESDEDAWVAVEGEGPTLFCLPRGAFVLDVRDAETGEPLAGVDVARAQGWVQHPGPEPRLVVEDGAATLELDPDVVQRANGRLRVSAPGYAWKSVRFDLAGERETVLLERGGSVSIRVEGLADAEGLTLLVESPRNAMWYSQPLEGDTELRLDGVPAGRVEARVQRGGRQSQVPAFAFRKGEATAGGELQLKLPVDGAAIPPLRSHELTVEALVPASWGLESLDLRVRLRESESGEEVFESRTAKPLPAAEPGGARRFRFELGAQPEGEWTAELDPTGVRARFELVDGDPHEVEVGELATVTVDVTLPGTDRPAEGASVAWMPDPDAPIGMILGNADPVEGVTGRFRLVAPAGPVGVHAFHPDYGTSVRNFELKPGEQTLKLPLLTRTGVELRLLEADKVVTPRFWGIDTELRRADGAELGALSRGFPAGGLTLYGLEPGPHVATLPVVPGYEPLGELEFEVVADELRQIDVQVRKLE